MSKILLIEDEAGIRRTLTVSLMQEGHEVEPCENGLSGLARLENYSEKGSEFDAVILDVNLPDINGLKILRFLKEKHPELPVMMITGYGDEAMEEEVKARKGDAYIEKPIEMEKLDAYLQSILARKDEILGDRKTTESDEVAMETRSGYAFIRMNDEDEFLPTYQKLYFDSNVLYCDATRGAFDMVLLLQGKSTQQMEEKVENLKKMAGMGEIHFASVERPILSEDISKVVSQMDKFLLESNGNRDFKGSIAQCPCSAYALLEIEPGKLENVFRQLYFMDNVVSCDCTKGSFQMALLLKAPTYGEINEVVNGRIARLDGVLRAIQCDIINLMEA